MNTQTLDLAPIGNCAASALIDRNGRFVWACAPRVDSDPIFGALLGGQSVDDGQARGVWSIDLEGETTAQQAYERNTPVLRTVLRSHRSGLSGHVVQSVRKTVHARDRVRSTA